METTRFDRFVGALSRAVGNVLEEPIDCGDYVLLRFKWKMTSMDIDDIRALAKSYIPTAYVTSANGRMAAKVWEKFPKSRKPSR